MTERSLTDPTLPAACFAAHLPKRLSLRQPAAAYAPSNIALAKYWGKRDYVLNLPLNSSLSNRPWTDAAAAGMSQGGQTGRGKRALLQSFSLLVLNKGIVDDHESEWTEDDIVARSRALTDDIIAIWPGPDAVIQAHEYERARAEKG